ncbi:HD domain-containing protein [Clostridium beijerinckii]|uniref:ATP-binding protein n=2 Tax=Clostridium beijerinckii TaxID=1520 RepID=A0AAE2RWG3_CLOBE|nr:ATP-binding protein [Clostridium beijerinckii]ABR33788.1 hypothetical protein Cbei_1614 [Clostridium beijerinckii NCIMB 8052]AIU01396.1 hypothetical protein Cbs_1614 [Clostridium beijerinckii ATCC 35702]MBF7812209.1 ATP-binding protein [Clostridium beijerinckii]NRT24930.1 hypothetical protein [Clostridium beijerinckii]NRT67477.1 hypothetical protein [Clostridium beijerinckii]
MNSLNNECQGIKTQYSLVKHLKLHSECDEKYKNLYATWVQDEKVYTNALAAITTSFPHYSMHDASHSWSIVNKIEMVLGEARIKQLSPTDTFLILETAFVHDLGMIICEEEQKKLWLDIEFKKYIEDIINNNYDKDLVSAANYIRNIEKNVVEDSKVWPIEVKKYVTILNADFFRRKHNYRSAEVIIHSSKIGVLQNRNNLIQERIMRLIAQISIMHVTDFSDILNKLYQVENGVSTDEIHPRMIACLLRLGDLLDLDNGRFSEVLSNTIYMPKSSQEHKEKHQAITHFLVSPERIEVAAICPDDSVYRATRQWFEWLQEELKNLSSRWSDIVPYDFIGGPPSLGDIKLSIRDGHGITEQLNYKFSIDQKIAFEFIEGSGIYENKLDCIREIIQNALDATKLQIWNDIEIGKYKSLIEYEDIECMLAFSSNIPEIIRNLYPITITLEYIEDSKGETENDEFIIMVEDCGCGISKQDLKRVESVGHSWNGEIEKYKIINRMPEWMRPTGDFGIGLHSIFMITDEVEIETKAEDSEAYNFTFVSSKNNGYISTKINKNRKRNGTKISFKFKSKFIEEFESTIDSAVHDELKDIDRNLDLVDNKYKSKRNKKRMCALLNSYLNNIDWIKIEKCGILTEEGYVPDKMFNNEEINVFTTNSKDGDLEISVKLDNHEGLSAYVKDNKTYSEINFHFIRLTPYDNRSKSYKFTRMSNTSGYGLFSDKSEIYFKDIFCTKVSEIHVFKTKVNIVEGKAKELLSINRNRIKNRSILNKYINRINDYILKKVIFCMWKHVTDIEAEFKFNDQNSMDMVILTLYYNKYYDKSNFEIIKNNVVFNKWGIRESYKINKDGIWEENITLKELISKDKVIIADFCNENIKAKAVEYNIDTILESVEYIDIELLGYDTIEFIDSACYIAHKNTNFKGDYINTIVDYNNKKLLKILLNDLYDKQQLITRIRTKINGFKYKNKENSSIIYLVDLEYQILSPFTSDMKEEIFKKNIDQIINDLKKNYKFDELIEYVYNNSLHKEFLQNERYKEIIENAYKELILDYINYAYSEYKYDNDDQEAAIDLNNIKKRN